MYILGSKTESVAMSRSNNNMMVLRMEEEYVNDLVLRLAFLPVPTITHSFKMYANSLFLTVLLYSIAFADIGVRTKRNSNMPYYGIPVPGRTVSALDVFRLFANTCRPKTSRYEQRNLVEHTLKLLANPRGQEIAQRVYNDIYLTVGDVDIEKMMGKWYRVVDSPSVHHERCIVSYYEILHKSDYLATFTVKDYFRNGESVEIIEGHGTKIGPDAGQLLIYTGHPADPCPYSVVKTGPVEEDGLYSYIILTQFFKHPVIGLARDPRQFQIQYQKEVKEFLESQNLQNPLTNAYNLISYSNFTNCPNDYYFDLKH